MSEAESTRTETFSPYKGLAPYQEEDWPYFFGRGEDSETIAANILATSLTVLYGASGVGKSSVLQAGVPRALDSVANVTVVQHREWQQADFLEAICQALDSVARHEADSGGYDTSDLVGLAARADDMRGGPVILIMDQFEEYFLYRSGERAEHFETKLAELANRSDLDVHVLISLRDDSIAKLDLLKKRIPDILSNMLELRHLDRVGAEQAITGPILRYDKEFNARVEIEEALIPKVLSEVLAGRAVVGLARFDQGRSTADDRIEAPYLQLVMDRLWKEEIVKKKSQVIRLSTLDRLGGASDIIRNHLDDTMAKLSDRERDIAARVLNYLVTPSGSKIALCAQDLADEKYTDTSVEEVVVLLGKLVGPEFRTLRTVGFVNNQYGPEWMRYEIYHDVLGPAIQAWRQRYSREIEIGKPIPDVTEAIEPGIALCLSGGGYKAAMFQVGVLWRLNELGYLRKLSRIASVSGSSLTAAYLGMKWSRLEFDDSGVATRFQQEIIAGLRRIAAKTIDLQAILLGLLGPGNAADRMAKSYQRYLFGDATLQDLPDEPSFVFCATNLQSGALWRFTKAWMRDWRVGEFKNPTTLLAGVVAASAATPPILSPMRLNLDPEDFIPNSGHDLQHKTFMSDILLSDGAIYDNLALETAWKLYRIILVSDGGGALRATEAPGTDWARQSGRVLDLIHNQTVSLRKRQLIQAYINQERHGAYWGIRSDIDDYNLEDALPCPYYKTSELASWPSRFAKLSESTQERLINWGYAVCDAAIRKQVNPDFPPPRNFPYVDVGI